MYIYIYIYIYIHIYLCIYINIHICIYVYAFVYVNLSYGPLHYFGRRCVFISLACYHSLSRVLASDFLCEAVHLQILGKVVCTSTPI